MMERELDLEKASWNHVSLFFQIRGKWSSFLREALDSNQRL